MPLKLHIASNTLNVLVMAMSARCRGFGGQLQNHLNCVFLMKPMLIEQFFWSISFHRCWCQVPERQSTMLERRQRTTNSGKRHSAKRSFEVSSAFTRAARPVTAPWPPLGDSWPSLGPTTNCSARKSKWLKRNRSTYRSMLSLHYHSQC